MRRQDARLRWEREQLLMEGIIEHASELIRGPSQGRAQVRPPDITHE